MTVRRVEARTEPTEHLGHLRLYRDDLEAIATVLCEVGQFHGTCGGLEFNQPGDIAQLDELPPELPDMKMAAVGARDGDNVEPTSVEISLSRSEAKLYIVEPTTHTFGVRDRIREIGKVRRRILIGTPLGRSLLLVLLMVMGASLSISALQMGPNSFSLTLMLPGLFLTLVALSLIPVVASPGEGKSSARMINAARVERPSFWEDKQRDIYISAVSLALGAVIGFLADKIPPR